MSLSFVFQFLDWLVGSDTRASQAPSVPAGSRVLWAAPEGAAAGSAPVGHVSKETFHFKCDLYMADSTCGTARQQQVDTGYGMQMEEQPPLFCQLTHAGAHRESAIDQIGNGKAAKAAFLFTAAKAAISRGCSGVKKAFGVELGCTVLFSPTKFPLFPHNRFPAILFAESGLIVSCIIDFKDVQV